MAQGYRWLASSVDGFIEQLVRYINGGHYFYVTGRMPLGKDPLRIDAKLLDKFECVQPRWRRSRRKLAGIASVHYLRYERSWILIATHGLGPFYEEHSADDPDASHQFLDCRRRAIQFSGYSIGHGLSERTGKGHTLVRLDAETYKNLKAYFLDLAVRRGTLALETEFSRLSFQPYRPVREQLFAIVRGVNRRRKLRGFEPLDWQKCIKSKRRITKPFGEHEINTDETEAA